MHQTTMAEQWQELCDDQQRAQFERLYMRGLCFDRQRNSRYLAFADRSLGHMYPVSPLQDGVIPTGWSVTKRDFDWAPTDINHLSDIHKAAMRKLTALQKDWFVWDRKKKVKAHVKFICDLQFVIAINQKIVNF